MISSEGPLSAAEALALVGGENVDEDEVVFLALLELVVRGGLELVPRGAGHVLKVLPAASNMVTPLANLAALIEQARADDPRHDTDAAENKYVQRRFAERWGTAGAYVRFEIWVNLKRRGLTGAHPKRRVVGIWERTEAGDAERRRILGVGTKRDWTDRPATMLLRATGLRPPPDETFDILDDIEVEITPGTKYDPLSALSLPPSW